MAKTTARAGYAGTTRKHGFPRHRQEQEMSCGAACLRMLAEWLTGMPQSEYAWREKSGWTPDTGIDADKMDVALAALPPNCVHSHADVEQIEDVDAEQVYLLLLDSYLYDGSNVWHWVILLDLFQSKERDPQRLALYVDPTEDQLVVWGWTSLRASKVRRAFRITRTQRSC